MKQYIDKAVVVTEIERRIKEIDEIGTYISPKGVLTNLLCHLDTLDAKEVDLENLFQALPEYIADEKSHQIYRLSVYHYDGECVVDYVGELDHDSLYSFGGNTLHEAIEKAWNWLSENSTGG